MDNLKRVNLKALDLIDRQKDEFGNLSNKLIFLAGSIISSEPPSNLATGDMIVDDIIEFLIPAYEKASFFYQKIRDINKMSYGDILATFCKNIDGDMKIIEYFDNASEPNIMHNLLAHHMKNGSCVLTINLDCLIEKAFGLDDPRLEIVISAEDFDNSAYPEVLMKKGKIPLYKLYGSKRNLKTGEDTTDSLNKILDMFMDKLESDDKVLKYPYYEKKLFTNIAQGSTLIALGFSKREEFEILQAIKSMRGLKKIIWVDHTENGTERGIFKMMPVSQHERIDTLNLRDKELQQFMKNNNCEVYIVKANTAGFLCEISNANYMPQPRNDIDPGRRFKQYLYSNFEKPSLIMGLIHVGSIFYAYSYYDEAFKVWMEVLDKLKSGFLDDEKDNPDEIKANLHLNLGRIYLKRNNLEMALTLWIQAYDLFKQINDLNKMGVVLYNMGGVYQKKGQLDKALEMFQKGKDLYMDLNDFAKAFKNYFKIAQIFEEKKDYDMALKHYLVVYAMYKNLGDLQGMANVLEPMANVSFKKGDLNKALKYLHESYELNGKLGNYTDMVDNLEFIYAIYMSMGNLDKALEINQKMYDVYWKLEDFKNMSQQLILMGINFWNKGNQKNALSIFKQAYDMNEKAGNVETMVLILSHIGNLYLNDGRFDKAIENFKKAYNLSAQFGDSNMLGHTLSNLGMAYLNRGKINDAQKYLEKAIEYIDSYKDPAEQGVVLRNLALVYKEKKKYKKALDLLQKSQKIFNLTANVAEFAVTQRIMASIYYKKKQLKEVKQCLINAFLSAYIGKLYQLMTQIQKDFIEYRIFRSPTDMLLFLATLMKDFDDGLLKMGLR